jgi:large subunit ribosomal protein L22
MGARKRLAAEQRKAKLKTVAFAKLNDCPTSPRKMRLVADMVRGKRVDYALAMLRHSTKDAAGRLHKLILSALSNWQAKNESSRIEDSELIVKDVFVDGGRTLRRLRPAPQGRGYRIRKRSNHVTVVIDNKSAALAETESNTAN